MSGAGVDGIAEAVRRAAALLAADPAGAEQEARALLAVAPADPRPALILGSALRRRGDAAGALKVLEPLGRAYPAAANTQYELGLALASRRRTAEAEVALGRAVARAPDHADAWRALGDLLFGEGRSREAQAAFVRHRLARVRDPALKTAAVALEEGRPRDAESQIRAFLARRPDDTAALQLLAEALFAAGRYADADATLAQVLNIDPELDGARFAYARSLFHQQKAAAAVEQLERLEVRSRDDPAIANLLAAALERAGDLERSLGVYRRQLDLGPRQPLLWHNYGQILRTVGRREEAARAFRQAVGIDPGLGEAWLALAGLGEALSDDDVAALGSGATDGMLPARDRAYLSFSLGRALEARGETRAAFDRFCEGAALRRAELPYESGRFSDFVSASAELLTADFFAARKGLGAEADDPIFIVGLHRSGSTLIEQILASHSQVEGTLELPDIELIARSLGWEESREGTRRYLEALAELDAARACSLGEAYLAQTKPHRRLGRRFFTDKAPNNFQHLGLIRLILPNATIIDARRHPLGVGVSAFRQPFTDAQAFTYDLVDLGRYYRDYLVLMDALGRAVPGWMHRLIYEDLVDDPEIVVRRLLDRLDLPFEPGCLRFYDNPRPVHTVTSEQVRRPIYRGAMDLWRRYEPWLGPLKEGLGPALDAWRGA